MREETRCRPIGYSFRLAARVILYASSHRQDNTYHCLCWVLSLKKSETSPNAVLRICILYDDVISSSGEDFKNQCPAVRPPPAFPAQSYRLTLPVFGPFVHIRLITIIPSPRNSYSNYYAPRPRFDYCEIRLMIFVIGG